MKRLITLCLSLLACTYGHSQTTLYSQNFNSGSAADWTLNTTDLGGDASLSDNQWVINNSYAGGTLSGIIPVPATADQPSGITGHPESYYMHIFSALGVSLGGPNNDNFDAGGTGTTYFAAQNTSISTVGYTNVYFSFWWICQGDASCVGKVYYRTSSGGTWTQITTPISTFHGSSAWAVDSFHLAAFDGQAFLQFGFQFTDGSSAGTDPAFGVDDITVTGVSGSTGVVDSFTTTSTSSCIDSCITVTNATTGGTVDSVLWSISPSGPIVAASHSFSTPICFSSAGLYTVTLTAYSGGVPYTSSQVITVIPTPMPNITQSGNVLSVGAGYSSYQWYTGLTPIVGATTNSYTMPAPGLYGVVVDSGGCPGFDSLTVFTLHVNNVNSLSSAHFWIAQPDNSSININSSTPLNDELAVTIYDATGREILNEKWNAGSFTKQIKGLSVASGLYIIKLGNVNTSTVLKWLKQ